MWRRPKTDRPAAAPAPARWMSAARLSANRGGQKPHHRPEAQIFGLGTRRSTFFRGQSVGGQQDRPYPEPLRRDRRAVRHPPRAPRMMAQPRPRVRPADVPPVARRRSGPSAAAERFLVPAGIQESTCGTNFRFRQDIGAQCRQTQGFKAVDLVWMVTPPVAA